MWYDAEIVPFSRIVLRHFVVLILAQDEKGGEENSEINLWRFISKVRDTMLENEMNDHRNNNQEV